VCGKAALVVRMLDKNRPKPPWWKNQRINGWEGRELLCPILAMAECLPERAIERFKAALRPRKSVQKRLF